MSSEGILGKEELSELEKYVEEGKLQDVVDLAWRKHEQDLSVEEVKSTRNCIDVKDGNESYRMKIRGGRDSDRTRGYALFVIALSEFSEVPCEIDAQIISQKNEERVREIVDGYKLQDEAGIPPSVPERKVGGIKTQGVEGGVTLEKPEERVSVEEGVREIDEDYVKIRRDSQDYTFFHPLPEDGKSLSGPYEIKELLEEIKIEDGKLKMENTIKIEYE